MYAARHIVPLVALGALLAGCSEAPTTPPTPRPAAVIIAGSLTTVYAGDAGQLEARVIDQFGDELSGVELTWETAQPALMELAPDGSFLALAAGDPIVRARVAGQVAIFDEVAFPIASLPLESITITNGPISLAAGDARVLGVRLVGPGDRTVTGRLVTLAADDPSVATIDGAGRVRGVGEGVTTVRATADGVEGTVQVTVGGTEVSFDLASWNGHALPFDVDSGWVSWDGVEEFHVVRVDSGTFRLYGADVRRWELRARIMQYRVAMDGGTRTLLPVASLHWTDRGLVSYDQRGELLLTSELYGVAAQRAELDNAGASVRYRIPGEADTLRLTATRRQ